MARINTVKKARKGQGNCRACGKPILAGMGYKYKEPRYGGKIKVHEGCEMKHWWGSSSKMVVIWEALDGYGFSTDNLEDAVADLNNLAETAREVGEEYQEGADNQREYFPDSEVADENEEKAQNLDSWADELEEAASTVEEAASEIERLEGEKADLEAENETAEEEDDAYDDRVKRIKEIDEEIEQQKDEAESAADVANNCPE